MLASSTNVVLPFNTFSRHRTCSGRRLRLCLSFPRFSSPFSSHPNTSGTLEYAAAASPDGDLIETPITVAADDATILRTLSSRQKEQISVFVSALLEWNVRMNLTSERQESEVMKRHVEDSLALLPPLRRSYLSRCCSSSSSSCDGLKLVDVGSGSGFPGLILAIVCPTWNVTLLESMQKRCFFLEHVVKLTGLSNVEVLRERAENVGQCLDFRELFDVAVARAVAEMRILVEYCLPLVRVGGLFLAAKGHNPQEEIRNSEKAIQLMGGSMVELCTVESHSPLGQRTAVICFKEYATPKKYPRNTDKRDIYKVISRTSGPSFYSEVDKNNSKCIFHVVVCGGTLGIFIATALVSKGLRVGIVERNQLKGREQEWNISGKELMELVHVGILTKTDIEQISTSKFNPNRCGFEKKGEIWVEDILNLGVSPAKLLEIMKKRFVSFGGIVFEGKSLSSICIYDDAAVLKLNDGGTLSSHLVIDSMGNFSPLVQQMRSGRKPDGVCLVVGSCSRGFQDNSSSDIIFSNFSVKKFNNMELQYFWEAFPAGSGPTDRTTYMFTYVEAKPGAPTLEELLEDYWNLLPQYQGVAIDKLEVLRVIFGIFPTFRDSPLPTAFDRILQVGDASGIQSPVSFGGFGSMTRHLRRLSAAKPKRIMVVSKSNVSTTRF